MREKDLGVRSEPKSRGVSPEGEVTDEGKSEEPTEWVMGQNFDVTRGLEVGVSRK